MMIMKVFKITSIIFISLSLPRFLNAITQKCPSVNTHNMANIKQNQTTECPPHSKCNKQGFCACEPGYFGDCQNSGSYVDSQSKYFTVSQNNSYFIIDPLINQFVTFQFTLCNQKYLVNDQVINLWVDDGNLVTPTRDNALGSDKLLAVSQGCIPLITPYFTFNLQPNGEKEILILGIKLKNPDSLKIQIIVQEISIFGFDIIFKIILILIGGIVLISIGGLLYCMYKCRRRRRHGLIEQRFDISFFEEYMPAKKANLKQMKEDICSVCLGEYKESDQVRGTICSHYFHKACLDQWCATHLSCPICRTSFEKPNLVHYKYLMNHSLSSSTNENDSAADVIISKESNLREPIV